MGGCCCHDDDRMKDKSPLIIDAEEVIADAVWKTYCTTLSWWQKKWTRRGNFRVDVPMHYFKFEVTKDECPLQDEIRNAEKQAKKKPTGTSVQAPLEKASDVSREYVGLKTEFKNNTGIEQTYNFKCEKTRKTTMSVTCQTGFSFGGKINFTLGLPKVAIDGKFTGETDMRVTVTKTKGQIFEQTLTTCTTSDFKVQENSHYKGTVTMDDRHLQAGFKVWVTMSMPAKKAKIVIYNKRGEPVHFETLKNLQELFPEENAIKENGQTRDDAVQFVIEGQVDGIQVSSYCIDLADQKDTTK